MFFGITQNDTLVRVDIDEQSVPAGVDQFTILEKVKQMIEYWSQFDKVVIHIQKPAPQEPAKPMAPLITPPQNP
jgi:hypothetical protein